MKLQYLTPFLKSLDMEPWEPVIPGLIEDAMMREYTAYGLVYPVKEAKINSQKRAKRFLKMFKM